jgi:site-specific DNA-methyltransferase (adenine-specific)
MTYTILHGNNLDVLPTLPDNSVDSIVTDPPYELGFMGKKWDSSGIAYSVELWTECLRVLKPGGHLLSFGGTRTYHRVAVAIEDAGFEIRDNIAWLYGSGFPKSHNVSKSIDRMAGVEREVIGSRPLTGNGKTMKSGFHQPDGTGAGETIKEDVFEFTAPATDEAKQWEGWGTALKPAHEPIIVARKPLIGTVAHNVLTHGTGALNIDGSRIGTEVRTTKGMSSLGVMHDDDWQPKDVSSTATGRWPANIILDEHTAGLLDEQSGQVKGGTWNNTAGARHFNNDGKPTDYETKGSDKSIGGASRFFYVAKANKRDRNEGLDGMPIKRPDNRSSTGMGTFEEKGVQPQQNFHPTVKPTALMEYLVKLVTPPNGTVLDPFTGSGSTGKAAILNGFDFIGIELTEDYLPIIDARLKHAEATYGSQIRMD